MSSREFSIFKNQFSKMSTTQNPKQKNLPKRLYIVYGGPSSEREVSFASKDYFYNLYKDQNPILVEWLEDFSFQVFPNGHSGGKFNLPIESKTYTEKEFYKKLSKEKCIVIIAGHGEYIEDGYLQEKLSLNKIAFTGSSTSSCRLAMDKYESQLIAKKFVNIIPTYKCKPKEFDFKDFEKYLNTYPIFAKPNNLGSSVGCYIAKNKDDLQTLLKKLENIEYLFQPEFKGVELTVGSIKIGDKFLNLPVTEIRPKVSSFFNWEAKYSKCGSEEITPATVDNKIQIAVVKAANKIHKALGLGFYSRSDFILDPKGKLYYLETNPYPGMSRTSILPQQISHSGNIEIFSKGLINVVNLVKE